MVPKGIMGPVQLIGVKGDQTVIKGLSLHTWTYETGLRGIDHDRLFSDRSLYASRWRSGANMPVGTRMTWYKTTVKAPLGTGPVVLNISDMGKGEAWVNRLSQGRYWPSFVSDEDGCTIGPCDYRGKYNDTQCLTNCGQPTQIWYHVPRSLQDNGNNTLVLFKEFGGSPAKVNFQTIAMERACANAYEGSILELSCEGRPISGIKFARFGDPQGTCGAFKEGSCKGDTDALEILSNACFGSENCSVDVSGNTFGVASTCLDKTMRLAVEIVC